MFLHLSVILFIGGQGISLTVTSPWTENPWTEAPIGQRPPGQRLPSWTETPLLDRDSPPGQRLLWTETLPPTETPWTETPPGQSPPPNRAHTPCTVKSGRYASYWLMLHVSSLHNSKLNESWSSPGVFTALM